MLLFDLIKADLTLRAVDSEVVDGWGPRPIIKDVV